jgi:hypothetical protein
MKYDPPFEVAPGVFLMGVTHKREGWLAHKLRTRRFNKAWKKSQKGDSSDLLKILQTAPGAMPTSSDVSGPKNY